MRRMTHTFTQAIGFVLPLAAVAVLAAQPPAQPAQGGPLGPGPAAAAPAPPPAAVERAAQILAETRNPPCSYNTPLRTVVAECNASYHPILEFDC